MLRGASASKILQAVCKCRVLQTLELGGNFLGVKGAKTAISSGEAPINMLADFLIESKMLERLDISNNLINPQSANCIASGLAKSGSIEFVNIEGNPKGAEGRQSLMQARNLNHDMNFVISMMSSDNEIDNVLKAPMEIFCIEKPEGA